MKKLNIDTKKHMGYSKSVEQGIKARLRPLLPHYDKISGRG